MNTPDHGPLVERLTEQREYTTTGSELRQAITDAITALSAPLPSAIASSAQLTPRSPGASAELVEALRESSSLLAFLHGAFGDKLKPADVARMTLAHRNSRAALSVIQPRLSADKLALEKVAGLSTCGERGLFLDKRNSRDLDLDMAIELARSALKQRTTE